MSFRVVDSEGNEVEFVVGPRMGWDLQQDGTVRHFSEDEDGCEEWTEPLWSSPIRDVFAPWLWDLLDERLDPRNAE